MVDWGRLEGFEWDAGNRRKSELKHGVSAAEVEQLFFNEPLLVLEDRTHSGTESRWHALGCTDGARLLHVTLTLRADGKLIRAISARDTHRKERKAYEQDR